MHIIDQYKHNEAVLSLEVFPPKGDAGLESITGVLSELAALKPGFISVTYGAGGTGIKSKTAEIAGHIKNDLSCEPMAHLTVVGKTKREVSEVLENLKQHNIENVLALRGDVDENYKGNPDFPYAKDLIAYIRAAGDFGIGGAFYPEGHIDCDSDEENLQHLLQKQEAGVDFLISQLFFDTEQYLRFVQKARARGAQIPLVAGIMPIMSKNQVQRMIFQCGVSLPSGIIKILHRYENHPESLLKAGIEYAQHQFEVLAQNGERHVHLYTMNKPQIARECKAFFDEVHRV